MLLHSLMKPTFRTLFLATFALTALVSMTNAACSSPSDIDHGASEALSSGHRGPYQGGGYEGYFATDLVADEAF